MPMFKEAIDIDKLKIKDFYTLLSAQTGSMLIVDYPSIELDSIEFRAKGNMMLFQVLYERFSELIDADTSLTAEQNAMAKLMIFKKINNFVFATAKTSEIKDKENIITFLKSQGINGFTLTLSIGSGYPTNLKSIRIDRTFYNKIISIFDENAINQIIDSLDPLGVAPRLSDETHVSGYQGVVEYYSENILRAQQEQITKFGNFLKTLANSLPTGHKLGIHPFNTYYSGFAFSQRKDSKGNLPYLSFFPSPDNALANQVFLLGKEDFSNFGDSYIKILGGLLVDHQTFVIEEIDSSGRFVRYLILQIKFK